MSRPEIKAVEVDPEHFQLAQDPEAAALLDRWTWYSIEPHGPDSSWAHSISVMRDFVERAGERLSSADTPAWLSLFGPFLQDGILGTAAKLIDSEGERFVLPSVQCDVMGPGYVEALLNVEWQQGYLARLFEPSPGAPGGFLPCTCRTSLMFVPAESFMDLGLHAVFDVTLSGGRLRERTRLVLEGALHLALPNLDFEHCYLGTRQPQSADVRALLGAY